MRKFVVPQFIDIEDKIIGSITTRQFVIIIVTGLLVFLSYRLSEFNLFLLQGGFILIVGMTLAFVRINGSPFHIFALNFISRLRKPELRVWRKELLVEVKEKNPADLESEVFIPKQHLSATKLSELALIVDTGGIYKGEQEANFIHNAPYGQK
jgi:hypothetical protein